MLSHDLCAVHYLLAGDDRLAIGVLRSQDLFNVQHVRISPEWFMMCQKNGFRAQVSGILNGLGKGAMPQSVQTAIFSICELRVVNDNIVVISPCCVRIRMFSLVIGQEGNFFAMACDRVAVAIALVVI